MSIARVRQVVERWELLGLARHSSVMGKTWVTLSQRGLRLVGLSYPTWAPNPVIVGHHHAVAWVRMELARERPELLWIPDRELRVERSEQMRQFRLERAPWHLPDAELRPETWLEGDPRYLVEVELSQKAERDLREAMAGHHLKATEVHYLAAPRIASGLEARISRLQAEGITRNRAVYRVRPLPPEVIA